MKLHLPKGVSFKTFFITLFLLFGGLMILVTNFTGNLIVERANETLKQTMHQIIAVSVREIIWETESKLSFLSSAIVQEPYFNSLIQQFTLEPENSDIK